MIISPNKKTHEPGGLEQDELLLLQTNRKCQRQCWPTALNSSITSLRYQLLLDLGKRQVQTKSKLGHVVSLPFVIVVLRFNDRLFITLLENARAKV